MLLTVDGLGWSETGSEESVLGDGNMERRKGIYIRKCIIELMAVASCGVSDMRCWVCRELVSTLLTEESDSDFLRVFVWFVGTGGCGDGSIWRRMSRSSPNTTLDAVETKFHNLRDEVRGFHGY